MSGHEETIVIGKLSKDPELKYTAAGLAVTRFSIPVDRKVGQERKTVWWNVLTYDKIAEGAHKNLHKGSLVRVSGVLGVDKETMNPEIYEKDGVHKSSLKLVAHSLAYLDNFGNAEKPDATQDEIPF